MGSIAPVETKREAMFVGTGMRCSSFMGSVGWWVKGGLGEDGVDEADWL